MKQQTSEKTIALFQQVIKSLEQTIVPITFNILSDLNLHWFEFILILKRSRYLTIIKYLF